MYDWQLSVRAATNLYFEGGAVPVDVILRNTGTNDSYAPGLSYGADTQFRVFDETGDSVQLFMTATSFTGWEPVLAQHQKKFKHDLAGQFGFKIKPGIHTIYGEQRVWEFAPGTQQSVGMTNLCSGMLTITVLPRKQDVDSGSAPH
jgi:hypothetical protein